jgi:hypothetical protein
MSRQPATERLNLRESERVRIPVAEERIRVGTRVRRTGSVRVRTRVEQRSVLVNPPLRRQQVHVVRHRIDRYVDQPPEVRREGDTLVVPIVEEVVVTRLKLVEEVRITLRRSVERRPQRVELRRQRAIVERLGADEAHDAQE